MTPTQELRYSAAAIKNGTTRTIAALSIRSRRGKRMVVWIVEVVDPETGTGAPLMGYCFLSEGAANHAIPGLIEEYPESNFRSASYFSLRREDLEWAICHLGIYAHSEELERIKGAMG